MSFSQDQQDLHDAGLCDRDLCPICDEEAAAAEDPEMDDYLDDLGPDDDDDGDEEREDEAIA